MRIVAATWSYPPARFIGSELMTHRLLRALVDAGHEVTVVVKDDAALAGTWEHEGIPVQHRTAPLEERPDLVICHVDLAMKAWMLARRHGVPLVGICHNTGPGVQVNIERIPFARVIVNSASMMAELGVEGALVVNPPLRDHRQPDPEQDRPVLAHRTPAA